MDLPRLIHDLQACCEDGEWERAGAYYDELGPALDELLRGSTNPRNAGAMRSSLRGVQQAFAWQDSQIATAALRHLGYLVADRDHAFTSESP